MWLPKGWGDHSDSPSRRAEDFIPSSLPESMSLRKGKHLFEQIHGKDPYLQVKCAAELGLGSRKYKLETIE